MNNVGEEVQVEKVDQQQQEETAVVVQQQQEVRAVEESLDGYGWKLRDNDQTVVVDKYQVEEGQVLEYDVAVSHDSTLTVMSKVSHT